MATIPERVTKLELADAARVEREKTTAEILTDMRGDLRWVIRSLVTFAGTIAAGVGTIAVILVRGG